jgi:hypothetical protein
MSCFGFALTTIAGERSKGTQMRFPPADLPVAAWTRRFAMLGIALITAGCGAGTPGQAFVMPEGFARSGMSVAPGATAVIGLGDLKLAGPGVTAKLVSLSVVGDQIGAQAGRVLGVKVYRLTDSGGIGAITEADLSGVDGNGGWQLESPTGAVVTDEEPLGVVVLVQGEALGTWSSDSFVVEFTIDGRQPDPADSNWRWSVRRDRPSRWRALRSLNLG